MTCIAIPKFQTRVSPVLDTCSHLLLIEVEKNSEIDRHQIYFDNISLDDRLNIIKNMNVDVIICCAVSEVMDKMLRAADIQLVCGIVGDINLVLKAYLCNKLDDTCFHMPGFIVTE